MTVCVVVEGGSDTVTVTGCGVTVAVVVTKSVVVWGAGAMTEDEDGGGVEEVVVAKEGVIITEEEAGVLGGWGMSVVLDIGLLVELRARTVEVSSTSTAEVTTWVTITYCTELDGLGATSSGRHRADKARKHESKANEAVKAMVKESRCTRARAMEDSDGNEEQI